MSTGPVLLAVQSTVLASLLMLPACMREPGRIEFGKDVDDSMKIVNPATSFVAGEEFGYLAQKVRCNEASLTRRVVRFDNAAEKVTDEAEVHWEAGYEEQSDVLRIDRPGAYGVKLLCRGEVVAVGAVTIACIKQPHKMSEWESYLSDAKCIEHEYLCAHYGFRQVLSKELELDHWPMDNIRPSDHGNAGAMVALFKFTNEVRKQFGCSLQPFAGECPPGQAWDSEIGFIGACRKGK